MRFYSTLSQQYLLLESVICTCQKRWVWKMPIRIKAIYKTIFCPHHWQPHSQHCGTTFRPVVLGYRWILALGLKCLAHKSWGRWCRQWRYRRQSFLADSSRASYWLRLPLKQRLCRNCRAPCCRLAMLLTDALPTLLPSSSHLYRIHNQWCRSVLRIGGTEERGPKGRGGGVLGEGGS